MSLVAAFPQSIRDDATVVASAFDKFPAADGFRVVVDGDTCEIPYRIDADANCLTSLSPRQVDLGNCLLTRHRNGFVRQEYLARIVLLKEPWVMPFVIQLLGEYVSEIIHVIDVNLALLDASVYGQFLVRNPKFWNLTRGRVASYWDCYYRSIPRADYVGFQVVRWFDEQRKASSVLE